ncbi:MAG TPA: ABC transporter permease [Rugosimonospora sp.]|nr:ABC transporter permease [Rugosimonospora sp.]
MTRYRSAARMEWIKLRSVRSSWWLLISIVVSMAAVGVGVGAGYRSHTPVATPAQIVNNALAGAVLAQLLIGALGILTVTSEYTSGMIRATLAAQPHRGVVLVAKTAVLGLAAFGVGELSSLAAYLGGQAAITGSPVPPASLGDPAVLRAVLLTGAYLGLVGLLGVGVGTLIRHTGGAIGALFGVLVVPMFLALLFGSVGVAVLRYVPMFILVNSIAVVTPVPGTLHAWAGIGVQCLYAAAALGAGSWVLLRRDA